MADIFISYSSKDREQAEQLTELLGSAGLSVWIDKHGIEAATSWSSEIVDAIDSCRVFVVLLSAYSVASVNVVKEVSLAAEQKKKILPIDLEPIELPRDLRYHLAGIQRSPATNIDAIIRAIGKLGLEATKAPEIKLVKETDSRKSLMILPFEDLSPTRDNSWFADGIVSELIGVLSNVRSLRIADNQATREFKNYHGQLATYARTMNIRYFVQGDVRKFGDQIKISTRLLDIESGDYLWQDSLKGTMDDIFDIQETVAKNVAEGLKIILSSEEKEKIEDQPTENPDAYELYLKAKEFYVRHTRADLERSIALFEEAIRIDPEFAGAHLEVANVMLSYYRNYSREASLLERIREHIASAEAVVGESAKVHWIRGILLRSIGKYEESIKELDRAIELDPNDAESYNALSMTYGLLGDWNKGVALRKKYAELLVSDRNAYYSYILAMSHIGDTELIEKEAKKTQALYERYLLLNPEDLYARIQYVSVLCMAGEKERGLSEADTLEAQTGLDGFMLFNLACIYLHGGKHEHGVEVLERSVEKGYANLDVFKLHPDLAHIRGTQRFERLMRILEENAAKVKQDG
jgi:TolB-like protein